MLKLRNVADYGRYEFNVILKKKYEVSIALVYPSTYQASLSSLGYQVLYYMLNKYPEVYAQRVVNLGDTPAKSIERGTPLRKFDVLMISASYELDYPVIINVLRNSGIPFRRNRRGNHSRNPRRTSDGRYWKHGPGIPLGRL